MNTRLAFRMAVRNRGFSALVVATMALGIGASTTMFSVIQAVFLRPLPFPHQERLVTLWESDPAAGVVQRQVTPANFVDWSAQSQSFESMGALDDWSGASQPFKIVSSAGPETVPGMYASSAFFRVLGVAPVLGRFLDSREDLNRGIRSAVIRRSYWQERFQGDANVIGKTIDIDTYGGGAFTIVGVMPDGPALPPDAKLWLSLGDSGTKTLPLPDSSQRCCSWFTVIARLKPGVTIPQAQAEMTAIAHRISERHPDASAVPAVRIVPLRDYMVREHRVVLFALFGAVTCLLLIACANVANLLLSRGVSREKEILTRTALGATRWQIARQLLSESLVLCALGAGGGLLVATWAQAVLVGLFGGRIPLLDTARIDASVLAFAVFLSIACALVCGLAPMIHFRAAAWQLRAQTENPRTRRLRDLLVIGEVALSLTLVAGAGLLIRTVVNLHRVDFGIRTAQILAISTDVNTESLREPGQAAAFLDRLLPRLRALPGAVTVAAATGLPMETGTLNPITPEYLPARTSAQSPQAYRAVVTSDYFNLMGIPLKSGRLFTDADAAGAKLVAVLSETAARRYFPNMDPIGKRFASGSIENSFGATVPFREWAEWREIVGIVGDVRSPGFNSEPLPVVYYSHKQAPVYSPTILVSTIGDPLLLTAPLRSAIHDANPRVAVTRARSMEQAVSDTISEPKLRAALVALFAGLALLLGMLGIYGVASYTVTRRTHEIGIRMALGARRPEIARMIVGQSFALAAAGVALGFGCAAIAVRTLSSLLFGVQPLDPMTLSTSCILLVASAMLASYLPARRAMNVDPAAALRNE